MFFGPFMFLTTIIFSSSFMFIIVSSVFDVAFRDVQMVSLFGSVSFAYNSYCVFCGSSNLNVKFIIESSVFFISSICFKFSCFIVIFCNLSLCMKKSSIWKFLVVRFLFVDLTCMVMFSVGSHSQLLFVCVVSIISVIFNSFSDIVSSQKLYAKVDGNNIISKISKITFSFSMLIYGG